MPELKPPHRLPDGARKLPSLPEDRGLKALKGSKKKNGGLSPGKLITSKELLGKYRE